MSAFVADAPAVSQADLTVEATSPAGATVSYPVPDPPGKATATCAPPPGSVFPLGATTVTCTISTGGTTTFVITVVDTKPPVLAGVPSQITVPAGPTGTATVTYGTPTATDIVDGTVPVTCAPASGSTFSTGTTTVTCTAKDSRGNSASASFAVVVTGAPTTTTTTTSTTTTSTTSTTSTSATTTGATTTTGTATTATTVTVTTTAPTTTVTTAPFTPPAQPDRTPPGNVAGLAASPRNHGAVLAWKPPAESDFASVEVLRALARGGATVMVYRGGGSSFTDTGLVNGLVYRYVVVSLDRAGNRSPGAAVTLTPRVRTLVAPQAGATLKQAPRLRWVQVPGASYYNVQLFRGKTKILSVWPGLTHYTLTKSWRYNGRSFKLTPGTYYWYVWAGYGPHKARKYGPVLGQSSFVMA